MKHSKGLICMASALCLGVLTSVAISKKAVFLLSPTQASNNEVLLQHGDIASLDNTYKTGTFSAKTNLNNNISWEYKYGKSSAGLIEIGKDEIGNPSGENFYIGNNSPITSLSSLAVNFVGSDYLYIFGSSDKNEYHLVDTLTSTKNTSTRIAKYLYFRIVNGNQLEQAVTINSISLSYSCNSNDFTDEVVDITSNSILFDTHSALSTDEVTFLNGFNSTKSLKIGPNTENNTAIWGISLGHEYTGAEFKKATLSYYIDTTHNSNYDGSHSYTRFLIYPANNGARISSSIYFQTGNVKNNTAWNKQSFAFSGLTALSDDAVVNSLYIKSVYVKDYINIDQMHLTLAMEDLSSDIIATYESDDLVSENIHVGYGTVTSTFDYGIHSINSVRSSRISIDSDWRMWYYNDTGMGGDLKNHIVSFDIKYADFIAGKSKASASYKFVYESARYTVDITKNSEGVDYSQLENGWAHVEINVNDVVDYQGPSDDTSDLNNLGYNVGYARTIYVDNLHVDEEYVPVGPTAVILEPENNATVDILAPEAKTYWDDLHDSRSGVTNDYVLDIDEVNTTENHPRITNYYDTSIHYDHFETIILKYRIYNYATSGAKIYLSTNNDLSDAVIYNSQSNRQYSLTNLLRNTTYYWKVTSSDDQLSSPIYSFTTADTARFITANSPLYNIRDIGGYMTKSGKRIKQGLIYRGSELNLATYTDQDQSTHSKNLDDHNIDLLLNQLEIRKEFDLRSPSELPEQDGSGLGEQVSYYVVDGYCPAYTGISKNTYNINRIAPVFRSFLEADTKHVYFHCRGGADRTGTIGFILGGFLGMSFTDLCIEYELTSLSKNYRARDEASPYGSFPDMINQLYDNTAGYDHTGNHDIQEVCTNLLLEAGLTQNELNTLTSIMLEQ